MMSGGRAAEAWEGSTPEALASRWGVPAVHLFDAVGSTNDVARDLASSGAAAGTIVLADRQVAGRGRAGRGWDSPAGLGIWLSMVAPAPSGPDAAGLLPLRAGVAVAQALDRFVPASRVGLKWPNDIIVGGAKVAGLLCEGAWSGAAPGPVVVGLGLNVSHTENDLPDSLRGLAISLRMATTHPLTRRDVADAVVRDLLSALVLAPLPAEALAHQLAARDVLSGQPVTISDPGSGAVLMEGVGAGIGADGALWLEVPGRTGADGSRELRSVRSGTVRVGRSVAAQAVQEAGP